MKLEKFGQALKLRGWVAARVSGLPASIGLFQVNRSAYLSESME